MAFGKNVVEKATGGADLTRPRLKLNWLLPAVVAVIILGAVVMIGMWVLNKAKAPVMGIVAKAPGVGASVASGQAPGQSSEGWVF
jgi:hypothetical protein